MFYNWATKKLVSFDWNQEEEGTESSSLPGHHDSAHQRPHASLHHQSVACEDTNLYFVGLYVITCRPPLWPLTSTATFFFQVMLNRTRKLLTDEFWIDKIKSHCLAIVSITLGLSVSLCFCYGKTSCLSVFPWVRYENMSVFLSLSVCLSDWLWFRLIILPLMWVISPLKRFQISDESAPSQYFLVKNTERFIHFHNFIHSF